MRAKIVLNCAYFLIFFILLLGPLLQAYDLTKAESPLDFGFHMSFGWKQDNLRITTSSSGLEKTGTTGEISLDTRYRLGSGCALNLNFPVGRPALFGSPKSR
jgi:hypothetical protein